MIFLHCTVLFVERFDDCVVYVDDHAVDRVINNALAVRRDFVNDP